LIKATSGSLGIGIKMDNKLAESTVV